jgi:hypothetical protein
MVRKRIVEVTLIIVMVSIALAAASLLYLNDKPGEVTSTPCGINPCTTVISTTTVGTTTTTTESVATSLIHITSTLLRTTTTTTTFTCCNQETRSLGFWLQESNVMQVYSPSSFFKAMFLTPPYPSSVEVMIFAPLQDETNGYGCSTSQNYVGSSLSYWGSVALSAESYPKIRLIFEIAFDPMSNTYGLNCFNSMVQVLGSYSSVYGIGVEGEFTPTINETQMQTAMSDVTSLGKLFINYYVPVPIPSGGFAISHTNFPAQGDQVTTLQSVSPQTIGISSGYYDSFPFPSTFTCPIGPNDVATGATTNEPQGWNKCVVSTELSEALSLPASARQFVELVPGYSASGNFIGASGQVTNQMWDNLLLRGWIWNDSNYLLNFMFSK